MINLNEGESRSIPKGHVTGTEPAIEYLKPQSEFHSWVLSRLNKRIRASETAMGNFYPRWAANERRTQAYIDLPDYEQMLKEMSNRGKPPQVTSVTVPYAFATISTIITYLIQTFTGQQPMFQVRANKESSMEAAPYMETALQYNADHVRLIKHFFQYFHDGEMYGVGVLRTMWETKRGMRTVWKSQPKTLMGIEIPGMEERVKTKENRILFEGTDVKSVDPFMFFPDPRVPMVDVNRKGEFVFWRNFEGKHELKRAEKDGLVKWVDAVPKEARRDRTDQSSRGLRIGGEAHAGARNQTSLENYVTVDQGTVDLVPKEWGLGDGEEQEKWLFAIANGGQIIQAEPLDADHDMHPVCVIEPYSMGYGFGQPSIADLLGPVQDTVSWFINSHIHNVRSALNNMFIVDPSRIEMQDLKNPEPGALIRLKKSAYGMDVRQAIQQFQVGDVTQGHIRDMEVFLQMGDAMSAINDNLRGIENESSRRSATEVRTTREAASSRLASHARLLSAQGVTDLAEQLCLNLQQNLTTEFMASVIGAEGTEKFVNISPELLVGDFYFPINDGTLPIDRMAMLNVWKELYLGLSQDPELRQQYDMPAIFDWIAELSGAKGLDKFHLNMKPDGQAQGDIQSGNGVPLQEAMSQLGSNVPEGYPNVQ